MSRVVTENHLFYKKVWRFGKYVVTLHTEMKQGFWMTFAAMLLLGCGDNSGQGAEHLLRVATQQYEECCYDAALRSIDSLRRTFPTVVEARKEALRLQRNIELRLAQEELTVLDSVL